MWKRLPFFNLFHQSQGLAGSEILARLKSLGEKDLEVGVATQRHMLDGIHPVACLVCEENLADTM